MRGDKEQQTALNAFNFIESKNIEAGLQAKLLKQQAFRERKFVKNRYDNVSAIYFSGKFKISFVTSNES